MTDPLVYKDERGCHIRIGAQWWHNFTPYLTRCLLKASGFADAGAIVRNAPRLKVLDFDYNGKWRINRRTVSEERMKTALEKTGHDDFTIEAIIRIHKLCHQIDEEVTCR